MNQIGNRRSSYDRVIHQYDSLTLDNRFQYTQFQMYAGLTFFLRRFDESSSNIAVLIEGKSKRNTRSFWISLRCRKSWFRNTRYDIRIYRIRLGKRLSATDSGVINLHSVNRTVQSCKIYIFKYTMGSLCSCKSRKFHIGFQPIFCDRKDLTRLNITDKFRTDRSKCTAFRSNHICISSFSKT